MFDLQAGVSMNRISKTPSAVQKHGNGSIVNGFDSHRVLKNPRRHNAYIFFHDINEVIVKKLGILWGFGFRKRRSAPSATVRHECKLRNDHNFALDIKQRTIHLPFVIFEDPQVNYFLSQVSDVILAITS
jgi:hypothetical protein